jgi:hypothetical protein
MFMGDILMNIEEYTIGCQIKDRVAAIRKQTGLSLDEETIECVSCDFTKVLSSLDNIEDPEEQQIFIMDTLLFAIMKCHSVKGGE